MAPTREQLEAYLARPWHRAREAKDRYWSERIAAIGTDEAFRVAEMLRAHAREMSACETDEDRAADLAAAVRLRGLLDRVGERTRRPR